MISKIVIDVAPADYERERAFWQAVVGGSWPEKDLPEYDGTELPGQGLELLMQRLDEGPSRLHLDIHTDDLDAEVGRLERLGARRIRQLRNLWILRDPAGLAFCVIRDPSLAADAPRGTVRDR